MQAWTTLIIFIALTCTVNTMAKDTYIAPDYSLKSSTAKSAQFNKTWEDEGQYKLQDSPENERGLASSPQEDKVKSQNIKKRDPSSIQKQKVHQKLEAKGWDLIPTLDY